MKSIAQAALALAKFWHSPPWQAPFHAEARGHSLRTRIGRLLEPVPNKDHFMRKLLLFTAVAAVLAAGWVRVQLVAVAQEPPKESTPAATTPQPETDHAPAGPPTKVARELLTYDGKRFEDYEAILASELAPDRRAEAIRALTAFAPAGYAKEVAEIILTEMASFDAARINSDRSTNLVDASVNGLSEIDQKTIAPLILEAVRDGSEGSRRLAIRAVRKGHASPELVDAVVARLSDATSSTAARRDALLALERLDPQLVQHWGTVRDIVVGENGSPLLRRTAMDVVELTSTDSVEFTKRYAREFAVPIQLARAERGELNDGGNYYSFRFAPDLVYPRVAAWAAMEKSPVVDGVLGAMLEPHEKAIPFYAALIESGDDEAKLQALSILQVLVDAHANFRIEDDSPIAAALRDAAPILGAATQDDSPAIAEKAAYLLKTLAWATEWRPTPARRAAETELVKRGVEFRDVDVTEFLRQRDRAFREKQQQRMLRSTGR